MKKRIKTLVDVPLLNGDIIRAGAYFDATINEHGDAVVMRRGQPVTLVRKYDFPPEFEETKWTKMK